MIELNVGLGERSYPILIDQGGLSRVGADLAQRKIAKRYAIISDDNVASLYGAQLIASLKAAGLECELFTFVAGEERKTLFTLGELASSMARAGFDRKDAIIGFGGGVPGDIAGYLAASWMRGIPFVQIPTTLLSQVDSSVGGKTGVDLPEGKNLMGAFYQPKAVYIDCDVLVTLPRKELLGGLAEVIKYGVIRDESFFSWLKENREAILTLQPAVVEKMVARCCEIKADVVARDEKEGGLRKILNYGHTIGHAVEGASHFTLIHGLAVSIGMVAAARLAVLKGMLTEKQCAAIIELLKEYGMPVEVPVELCRPTIRKYLLSDKKAEAGRVFFILPTAVGDTEITDQVTDAQIDKVLG
ncbi:3-dehydroquinate synthase [Desulforhopalus vacuolatus]|uniref:3-dehydroquinate synthase n=1 Tax=Desulforhopalus vacuolatus TaxID=40414 RepID=UPI00196568C2|nr:3-dehydroquinate synthase [Desulforhopalus vacuolatus]MBM9519558.1 3-dehydroquinate synthase [Desulforhopalus vacuolatus]